MRTSSPCSRHDSVSPRSPRRSALGLVGLAALWLAPLPSAAVTIDWVPIGSPGNAADTPGNCVGASCGSVSYAYQISKYEVTNAQYAEFLNAKAASDPLSLYNTSMGSDATYGGITRSGTSGSYSYSVKTGFADKPVVYVSFYDALRFSNWLGNGQGSGDTETGAYTLLGGTATPSNGLTVTRNLGATIFLTSENEWYKAAYYSPGGVYFDYPTGTNTVTGCVAPGSDTGNSANCSGAGGVITNVGAYSLSDSPYGTYDQGANVWEWNEQISSSNRQARGGSWFDVVGHLAASNPGIGNPSFEFNNVGYRVATMGACRDGLDNDGDGLVDYQADPGCASADDESEKGTVINVPGSPPFLTCDDGVDNDGDTLVDYPADPGCAWPTSYTESPECADNIDNDGNLETDHPADLKCTKPWDAREGVPGLQCGLGYELGVLLPVIWYLRERRRRSAGVQTDQRNGNFP